ncbi:MAG: sel1 repeat family protein, partial [Victivallales bacterium]|nr:sel1 repeat family protein [Victivallales bacterium]
MKSFKWLCALAVCFSVFLFADDADKKASDAKFDEVAWTKQVEELKALDQTDADVQCRLGVLLLQDKSEKSAEHWKKGFELLKKSADQGNSSALFHLGKCYHDGKGTGRDDALAYDCWRQVSEDEGAKEFLEATWLVGKCLLEGQGVAKDVDSAVEWIREAADGGLADAQFDAGLIYLKGTVQERPNMELAIQYFEKAAEK